MATDLAKLAIRVEALEARQAKKDLDNLTTSGKRAEKQTTKLSKAAKALGVAFAGVMVVRGVTQAFADSVRIAAQFEDAMSELAAITGLAGAQFQKIETYAKDFGRTTTLSASQAAEAFKLVASTQPQLLQFPDALAGVTKAAITLAEATGSTLPDAADTVGQSLNQFGLDASEANRVINVLAAGAQKGASFVNETAEALKFAGTVAATVGVSFESTNAAIQQLSTVGIKASEAGTALRNIFLKLEGQTEERFKPSVVGFEQALLNLKNSEISVTEQTELFGLRSVVAANNLINNAEAVDTLRESITGTEIAFEQQRIKVDNLEGSLKALRSAQEGLNIQIGGNGAAALRGYVDILAKATNAYTDFLVATNKAGDGNKVLEEIFRTLIRTLFLLANGFGVVKDTIEFFAAVVVNSVMAAGDVFSGVGRTIGSFFETFKLNIQIGVLEIKDFGDSIGAFAARAAALLKFDFDLADQIKAEREATEAANEAELASLRERKTAEAELRAQIREDTAASLEERDQMLAAYANEFAQLQQMRAEEIGMFFARTDASYRSQEELQAEADLRQQLHDEGVSNEEELQELLRRRAEISDNQRALDEVGDAYKTDLERAEEAAAAELAILAELGLAKNNLTEEQEAQRLEIISRVNAELEEQRAAAAEREREDMERQAEENRRFAEQRRDFMLELRLAAAEDEAEREQIRHEERLEAMIERAEELGIVQSLIDKAKEQMEEDHFKRMERIRERAGKKEHAYVKWLEDSKVKASLDGAIKATQGVAQHSKTMFKINKALALANAVVTLPSAVVKAIENGGGLPWGAIPGAITLAAGLAQIQAIKSSTYEGGGGGTTPSLAGSTPTYNGQPVPQQQNPDDLLNPPDTGSDDGTENRTNVVVTGNVGFTPAIIDEIAEGLREATGERDVVIFDENSRQAQDIASIGDGGG